MTSSLHEEEGGVGFDLMGVFCISIAMAFLGHTRMNSFLTGLCLPSSMVFLIPSALHTTAFGKCECDSRGPGEDKPG